MNVSEKAELALRIVREAALISFDTETSGLDWRVNSPIGYVICDGAVSVYVPIRHHGGGNLMSRTCGPLTSATEGFSIHEWETELEKAFRVRRAAGNITVGHNLSFDMHFSANAGVFLGRNCEDTQLNEAMLDEFTRSYSLDACAKAHGVTAKLGDDLYAHMARLFGGPAERGQMANFWKLSGSDELGVTYAEGDGTTTLELRNAQMLKIAEQELDRVHAIESKLIWTVFRLERRGMRVNEDRISEVDALIGERLDAAHKLLPEGFNVRSGPQIRKFMEESGHTGWPETSLGSPSFTESWLKGHDEGRAVINVRKLTNLRNSFIAPLKERHIYKGRVHSALNQLKSDEYGTISGRFSSSNPNMQQVPKRDKDLGGLFRSIFIPDDGMTLFEADFSQCEPRLFASYSKEPALLDGYNQTPFKDLHTITAEMLGVERDPTAKRMGMGILTGMGPKSLAGHMGWRIPESTAMYNQWMNAFPGIRTFQRNATDVFRSRGYVFTVLGRRCRLDDDRFAYRAVSRIIQGSNADILKLKMLKIDEFLEDQGDAAHLLMTIHDSYEFQIPDGDETTLPEIVRIAEDVQSPPINLRVPFVMEVGRGKNWAEATYGAAH